MKRSRLASPFLIVLLLSLAPVRGADDLLSRARDLQREIQETIARVRPSVVSIQVTGLMDQGRPGGGGSGVVVTAEGHVLTNWHVVRGGGRITVVFSGNRRVRARVLGYDPGGDLALLVLEEPGEVSAVELGDSDEVSAGQWVLAMGNPRGNSMDGEATVTWGIVTALHSIGGGSAERELFYGDAIQTDAEINPGNSGGPLFDLRGRLIGLNGRIATRDRVASGAVNANVGFSIPVGQIRRFLPRLLGGGRVRHGWLGVRVSREGSPGPEVDYIESGSPAAGAGLRIGDRILALDGVPVTDPVRLTNLVSSRPEGERVALLIRRGEERRILVFALGSRPEVTR